MFQRASRGHRQSSLFALLATVAVIMRAAPDVASRQTEAASDLVAYDRSLPLDARQLDTREARGVVVTRLTFAAIDPAQGRVVAHVVSPSGRGPFAGILFIGELGKTRRTPHRFVDEATALAVSGVASIIVDGYTVETGAPSHPDAARRRLANHIIDVRRGTDLLIRQPSVDPRRIGFVGHDAGAILGAILAGIDRRASGYILMAGTTDAAEWVDWQWPLPADSAHAYRRSLGMLNPINFVGIATPAALFFQFAKWDGCVSVAVGAELFDEASQPKEVRWYDSGHDLNVPAAVADRRTWLVKQLGIVRGAAYAGRFQALTDGGSKN